MGYLARAKVREALPSVVAQDVESAIKLLEGENDRQMHERGENTPQAEGSRDRIASGLSTRCTCSYDVRALSARVFQAVAQVPEEEVVAMAQKWPQDTTETNLCHRHLGSLLGDLSVSIPTDPVTPCGTDC